MTYWQEYYKKNKKKISARHKNYWAKMTSEQKEKKYKSSSIWRKNNREKVNGYQKKKLAKIRQEVIIFLGGKCVKCGFNDWRALQIDHKKGGGLQHRKNYKGQDLYYIFYKEVMKDKTGKYQLLCANCNWIKKYERNENSGHSPIL